MAIRAAKLSRLQVAFPSCSAEDLSRDLTRDFLREGWLWKSGPSVSDTPRRRWFSLDHRRLMYLEHPLDPYPKGEIFIGNQGDGYSVSEGVPAGVKVPGLGFSLRTPQRLFALASPSEEDRTEWIAVLRSVMERPLSLQDHSGQYHWDTGLH
ncbi:hypothetical protein LAZ67_19001053 [Cordylochernes scorpioides]|uniref:PH domain-containing protein n=1 Tax=Cordylochernes scorpioides TaxID=51811 RepID=A0ABY6LHE8_9ARAC|nr:hypothetical protein LAZ67_19001053 [Cordylochernes scorpioides]